MSIKLRQSSQRGAALVVALLIISLVTAIAATATLRHQFMLKRLSNQLKASQAYSYLRATEMIAKKALMADLQLDAAQANRFDHLEEVWAQTVPPFLIEGGSYGGKLTDLQSKFNLNLLAAKHQSLQGRKSVPFTAEQGIFIRLLQSYNDDEFAVTYEEAVSITRAVLDWVDPDTNANFSYCEDDAYAGIEKRKPHKTPNQPFMSVSELRLICNMPVELYSRMKDDLTVWPRNGKSSININTASLPLLRSVIMNQQDVNQFKAVKQGNSFQAPEPIAAVQLEPFVELQKKGFTTWNQVITSLSYLGFWPGAPLVLHSDFFLLSAQAELDGLTQRYFSVLDRQTDDIKILYRSVDDL